MGLKDWIIPRDRVFFDALNAAAVNTVAASEALVDLFAHYGGLAERRQTLKDLEHKGDQITHALFDHLGRGSIRPLAREDVAALAKSFDDVVDAMYATVNHLYLYRITKPTVEMGKFAQIIRAQTRELETGLRDVRSAKTLPAVLNHCIEVNRLEAEADRLRNDTIAALFRGTDAIAILKHKDIYELLEGAADRCEDVADGLNYIVQKLQARR